MWKTLFSCGRSWLRLVHLAIDLCILLPHEVSEQDMEAIVNLQQKCIDLKALEVENWCDQ